jgi:hypothetical protein
VTGRYFGGWGRSEYSKECSKTTPDSGCEVIAEGIRLHMKIHTHNPTFLPVLSTSPIDYYYDGGTVRVNTEFCSWDTLFGLVNPRLRYSYLQVVFCVNLGTFFRCFLQLGWRLTGIRSTHTECSLNEVRDVYRSGSV